MEKAIKISESLAVEHPDLDQYQSLLASNYNELGLLHRRAGRTTEAFSAFQQSLEIKEQLATDDPGQALAITKL